MTAHVLKGTKYEIAQHVAGMPGEVREAIVFVEEPASIAPGQPAPGDVDIFAEMQPFVAVGYADVDDSREAIYTRLEGE